MSESPQELSRLYSARFAETAAYKALTLGGRTAWVLLLVGLSGVSFAPGRAADVNRRIGIQVERPMFLSIVRAKTGWSILVPAR